MFARVNEIEIAYDDVGEGVPVVFIHGFPHHRALWAPQLAGLSEQARCIAPDLRGFGESAVEPPYSMDQYADDVARLLGALGIERAVVGGLSMGGYVAFAMLRRHPHLVRGLILADTRAGSDSEDGRAKRREMIEMARSTGSAAIADAMITGMVGRSTRERNPPLVQRVHQMLASAPVDGAVGALEAMMWRPDSTPLLASIRVPTLIVVGEEDVITPAKEARAMHAAIAGSRLEVLARAGHVSNVERPAAFNHVVSEFLAGLA